MGVVVKSGRWNMTQNIETKVVNNRRKIDIKCEGVREMRGHWAGASQHQEV